MSAPTVIPAGQGEVVGDSPERRVEILSERDALHATWSRYAPGREGADLHVHRRHVDFFYVLEGELTLRLGVEDEQVALAAGRLARIPPMVVHGFRNGSAAEVRYLNLHAPGLGFAEYMRALGDGRATDFDQEPPPEEGVRPSSEAVIGPAEGGMVTELSVADGREAESAPARFLYVLDGELMVDGGPRAEAGAWLELPAGRPYALAGPARVLDIVPVRD
jgi:mannose-6-phosphate isomerase-like protein (cupin superfamily)